MLDGLDSQRRASFRRDPRLPNLFVVGAPKAGTTSLHSALTGAPRVFMSKVKEPGFFSSDRQFARGIQHYLDSYFDDARGFAFRGESTPWYLYSEKARRRIFDLVGAATPHIVILLRRPADRAYSMFLDQQRVGNEVRRFEDAVEEEINQIKAGDLPDDVRRRYIWGGQYGAHVKDWTKTFGGECVRVFLTDDLRHSGAMWCGLSDFLGQDLGVDRLSQLSGRERNVAGAMRWPRLDRALRSLEGRDSTLIRVLQQALPHGLDRRIAQAVFVRNQAKKPKPPPPPPPVIMGMLDEYFRPGVLELQQILDRPLTSWLPENIARRS